MVVDVTHHEHKTTKKCPIATISSISSLTNTIDSHPVAAVMGFTSNPTGYTANNISDVLSDEDEEDELDSDAHTCNTIIKNIDSTVITLPKADECHAPMTVWHLFWCTYYSPLGDLPINFNCLLDVVSHLVIIHEDLVNKLKLHCKKLHTPIFTKTAMHNDQKNIIKFDEFVKLQLYDASGQYVLKSVHTVISSSSCIPILLGLPFLKHNSIVIDVDVNTAIDKYNGFDLLNPPIAAQKPKPRIGQQKFNYEYHANILRLHKLLLEDLKTTLLHCKHFVSSEHAQKIDVVGAVCVRLERLAAQEKSDQMGTEILKTYHAVFEPCPHIDDLPTDVYCHIKLKDASKMITTQSYSSPQKY